MGGAKVPCAVGGVDQSKPSSPVQIHQGLDSVTSPYSYINVVVYFSLEGVKKRTLCTLLGNTKRFDTAT